MLRFIICCVTLIYIFTGGFCEDSNKTETSTPTQYVTDKMDGYNKNSSHCFRFTWLGPGYDNSSEVTGSCNDLSEKFRLKNTPCKQPLIITDNGEPPNMTDLFFNYRDYVLCRRSTGQVCLKYSYKYNGRYDNITYMCGKARTEGEGAETSGCFTQYDSGYEKQVCVCQPMSKSDNGTMPCNRAPGTQMSTGLFIACFLWIIVWGGFCRWN